MNRIVTLIIALFLTQACIPIRIAPKIEDNRIMMGKKFKRSLSRQYAFIFEDPKEADEFYHYLFTKFQLESDEHSWNIPFYIDDKKYDLSYTETEIPDKTINLVPVIIDAALHTKDKDPMFESVHTSRVGNWYLVLTVRDLEMKDCLHPSYPNRNEIIQYLQNIRKEYLATTNYVDVLFKK